MRLDLAPGMAHAYLFAGLATARCFQRHHWRPHGVDQAEKPRCPGRRKDAVDGTHDVSACSWPGHMQCCLTDTIPNAKETPLTVCGGSDGVSDKQKDGKKFVH